MLDVDGSEKWCYSENNDVPQYNCKYAFNSPIKCYENGK